MSSPFHNNAVDKDATVDTIVDGLSAIEVTETTQAADQTSDNIIDNMAITEATETTQAADETSDNTTVNTLNMPVTDATETTQEADETFDNTIVKNAAETRPQGFADVAHLVLRMVAAGAPDSATINHITPLAVQDLPTVPYQDGKAYTMTTPPEEFEDWVTYLLYCEEGPTIRVLCGKEFVDNRCVSLSELKISEKILRDHSLYFAALMAGPWKEALDHVVRLPDVRIEDFKRLYLTLLAGGAAARVNLGKPTMVITNLVDTYMLADYFNMPHVKDWLKASLTDYLHELRAWPSMYVNEILADGGSLNGGVTPSEIAEQMHKDKVADFGNAYFCLKHVFGDRQIMRPEELVGFLVAHCPRPLLASTISSMEQDFKDEVISAYLLL